MSCCQQIVGLGLGTFISVSCKLLQGEWRGHRSKWCIELMRIKTARTCWIVEVGTVGTC